MPVPNTVLGGGRRPDCAATDEDDDEEDEDEPVMGTKCMMYALAPSEVMPSKHKSAIVLVVEIERYQKNGSETISGNAVKIRVYCAFVDDSDARSLVRRFSCSRAVNRRLVSDDPEGKALEERRRRRRRR